MPPKPKGKLNVASLWKKAASRTITSRRVEMKVKHFISESKEALRRSDTADRADLARVRIALKNGDIAKLHTLEEAGRAVLDSVIDPVHGLNALHLSAAALGDRSCDRAACNACLRWLLDVKRVDIEAPTKNGRCALHIASNAYGCDEPLIALLLLARGADPLARTNDGDRASDFASLQKNRRVCALLKEAEEQTDVIAWAHAHPDLPKDMMPKRFKQRHHLSDEFLVALLGDGKENDQGDNDAAHDVRTQRVTSSSSMASKDDDDEEAEAAATAKAEEEPDLAALAFRFTECYLNDDNADENQQQQKVDAEVSLAERLAALLIRKSAVREWEPNPRLEVVKRAKAAQAVAGATAASKERSANFVATLRLKTTAMRGSTEWL